MRWNQLDHNKTLHTRIEIVRMRVKTMHKFIFDTSLFQNKGIGIYGSMKNLYHPWNLSIA